MVELCVTMHLECRVNHVRPVDKVTEEVKEIFNCGDFLHARLEPDKDESGQLLIVDAFNPRFSTDDSAEDNVVFAEMAHLLLQRHPEGRVSFVARKFDEAYGEPIHEFTSGIVVVSNVNQKAKKEEAIPAEAATV